VLSSFFDTNKLWTICKTIDDASIAKLSKNNGGTNGFADRIDKTVLLYLLITNNNTINFYNQTIINYIS
jgi:predicted chitinase